MQFHPNFANGALLTVVRLTHHILDFTLSSTSPAKVPYDECNCVPSTVLVQWKDLSCALLLCECGQAPARPQGQSNTALLAESGHGEWRPAAVHRALLLKPRLLELCIPTVNNIYFCTAVIKYVFLCPATCFHVFFHFIFFTEIFT